MVGSTRIRRNFALTAMLGCLALPVTASAGGGGSLERCRNVVLRTGDGSVYTRTRELGARNVTCRTARRVARIFLHGSEGEGEVRPLGYDCRSRAAGVVCRKSRKRVSWSW
jgi:hypothetical protein